MNNVLSLLEPEDHTFAVPVIHIETLEAPPLLINAAPPMGGRPISSFFSNERPEGEDDDPLEEIDDLDEDLDDEDLLDDLDEYDDSDDLDDEFEDEDLDEGYADEDGWD